MHHELTVAELVNDLFRTRRKDNGSEYTNQEVAAALEVDASYVGKLRKGKIPNPGRDTLKKLCVFFRVPASYFFPELEQVETHEPVAAEQQIRTALRSAGLSADAQRYVQDLIDLLRKTSQQ